MFHNISPFVKKIRMAMFVNKVQSRGFVFFPVKAKFRPVEKHSPADGYSNEKTPKNGILHKLFFEAK